LDKKEALLALATDINCCGLCPFSKGSKPVISRGDPRSALMIVSDSPRTSDVKSGESLSGNFGKRLNKFLEKAEIDPLKVYFTTLLKFPLERGAYFPEDTSPAHCFEHLFKQIQIVKPLVIVLLGKEVLNWVLARGTELEGKDPFNLINKFFRRRKVYGEIKFVVLPSLGEIIKLKDKELDEKCITAFKEIKAYIQARQKEEPLPDMNLVDIEKIIVHKDKEQLQAFKWKKPESSTG